jgi:membrane-bound metal-dependent hydrolase YbcI (DUF457 family)
MPITPLHLGLMAPFLFWLRTRDIKRGWLALVSFTLVNLWIDSQAIFAWFRDQPLPSHDEPWHTLHGALVVAGAISILGFLSWRWIMGAFYGGISHIYLDGFVHPEMQPFIDTEPGNPIYLGPMAMSYVSAALLPLLIWLIVLSVSSTLAWVRIRWEERKR